MSVFEVGLKSGVILIFVVAKVIVSRNMHQSVLLPEDFVVPEVFEGLRLEFFRSFRVVSFLPAGVVSPVAFV